MEKFYSREALKGAKTAKEKEKLSELARKEAKRMYARFMEAKARELIKEHRTIGDKELTGGGISEDELQGTPLSPDERDGLDKKEE